MKREIIESEQSLCRRIAFLWRCLILSAFALSTSVILLSLNQKALNRTQEIRFESHLLSEELKDSSDELTRAARTYVVTGDPAYEREYWHILDVRNGKSPRADGRSISLRKLMERLGFTQEELSLLESAEDRSNALVRTEMIAMNAVKGIFEDKSGNFTRRGKPDFKMAQKIMHDQKYHENKAHIMGPIRQFDSMLQNRTTSAVEHHVILGDVFIAAVAFLVCLTAVLGGSLTFAIEQRNKIQENRLKKIEELEAIIRLRDDFIAIASHELRTPLTPMKMQIQLAQRNLDDPERARLKLNELQKAMASADQQINRLSRLVEDLLDVSRISVGKLTLSPEKCDLSEIVGRVVGFFKSELEKAHCEFIFHSEKPVEGIWDPQRLEQIVVNLLSNAIKYGRGKPIEISVSSQEDCARIEVRDHGIGIDKENQPKLFGRFARLAPVEHYGGLGLGLFITRQIVEAHGGTIRVESEVGKGATFFVELPIREVKAAA